MSPVAYFPRQPKNKQSPPAPPVKRKTQRQPQNTKSTCIPETEKNKQVAPHTPFISSESLKWLIWIAYLRGWSGQAGGSQYRGLRASDFFRLGETAAARGSVMLVGSECRRRSPFIQVRKPIAPLNVFGSPPACPVQPRSAIGFRHSGLYDYILGIFDMQLGLRVGNDFCKCYMGT